MQDLYHQQYERLPKGTMMIENYPFILPYHPYHGFGGT